MGVDAVGGVGGCGLSGLERVDRCGAGGVLLDEGFDVGAEFGVLGVCLLVRGLSFGWGLGKGGWD